MAEKEVKIKVATETDIKDVDDLKNTLEELKNTKLQLQIDADTAELESVKTEIAETENRLSELKGEVSVDTSEIDSLQEELDLTLEVLDTMTGNVNIDDSQLQDIESHANELQSQIEELQANVAVDTTEIDELESRLTELESTQLDLQISVNSAELEQASSSMDDLNNKSKETSSSIDGLGSAITGIAAAAGLEQMVSTADNINNSWNRLELTFANTGVSIDQLKQKQSELQASTGQTGGTIRNFFNMMGIAGVTNTNLLSSSFEALSGKAYQTGQSVEQMEGRFQRMVMSGNASSRMLVSMGISAEDLAKAMGVSASEVSEAFKNMTPEERIQALTKAMGDGKQANEMYKNSFQGLKTQAEASLAGLVGAVGQAILPSIIPLLNLAKNGITTLTNAFKSLPEPVQRIIGGLGAVVLAAVTLVGVLGAVGTVVKTVKSGIQALNGIMKLWEGVTKAVELAQAALNFVMALNPIVLVVAAIVALIAILVYLYYTNEDVRNAVNGLWEAMVNAWNTITSTVMAAVQGIITYLQNLYMSIVTTGQWIWNSILSVLSFVATVPGRVWSYLMNIINRVIQFGSNVVSRLRSSATNAVNSFITGIASLPGRVYNELSKTLNRVMEWGSQIVSKLGSIAQQAWQAFVRGLGIGSPGYIQILTLKELIDTGKRIPTVAQGIVSNLAKMAGEAVNAWGTPSFEYGFENITKKDEFNIGNVEANSYKNLEGLLNKILDALSNSNTGEPSLIFNLYGDMDEEKRMEKFLKAVRRELNWNNKTAGRTIDG